MVAAGGGGSPQRLLQSLAIRDSGVPVLLLLRLLPPEYLGSNSKALAPLPSSLKSKDSFNSNLRIIDYFILVTNPGRSTCRGAYFNCKSQFFNVDEGFIYPMFYHIDAAFSFSSFNHLHEYFTILGQMSYRAVEKRLNVQLGVPTSFDRLLICQEYINKDTRLVATTFCQPTTLLWNLTML